MKRALILTLGLAALVPAAFADGLFEVSTIGSKELGVHITYKGSSYNVLSGPMSAKYNGGPAFEAYCVDLDHWNTGNPSIYTVSPSPITNLTYGGRAAYLYNKYAASVDTKAKGAALQLAIWDVVTDNGDGLGNGQFKSSGLTTEVKNLANSYLADSAGKSGMAVLFSAVDHGVRCDKNQNFMGPVPEPASLAAFGIGIASLLRRRKKNS